MSAVWVECRNSGQPYQDRASDAHYETPGEAFERHMNAMDANTIGEQCTDDKLAALIASGATAAEVGARVILLAREYAERCAS